MATTVCNIGDIAAQLTTASRIVVTTDFFWVYAGDGTQVKIPAEYVKAYLSSDLKASIKFQGGTTGIEVSTDGGKTWSEIAAYSDLDPDLSALIEKYKEIIASESEREANEATRKSNESARSEAEYDRTVAEGNRVAAEKERETNTATAISNAEEATAAANTAASSANSVIDKSNTAATAANDAATKANNAATAANTAASSANTAASTANTATSNANAAIDNANTAATSANTAATNAQTAADRANDIADHPNYVGSDYYVYSWNESTQTYDKTDVMLKGEGFSVSKVFASVSAMNSYTETDLQANDFVLINTGDVEQEDNAKLYVVSSAKSGGGYNYTFLVDMSGAIGFTGKTPQFSIGTVTTLETGKSASATLTANGTDTDGNPKYLLSLALPKGNTGDTGETGNGIAKLEQTTVGSGDGGKNVWTATMTNSTQSTFTVLNGTKGDKGDKGDQGIQGEQGIQGIQGEKGDKGDQGIQGIQGEKGEKGDKGDRGDDGTSISVKGRVATISALPTSASDGDCYVVTADEHLYVYAASSKSWVDCGQFKGDKGDKGDQGEQGTKGNDGVGVSSVTQTTSSTDDGGKNVYRVTLTNGNTYDMVVYNGSKGSNGSNGAKGDTGAAGVGIASVTQTTTSTADGGKNVITVTKTDNTTSTFSVLNGSKGSKGDKGDKGDTGATGPQGEQGIQGIQGEKGDTGSTGATGVGISSVTQTASSTADGGTNTYRITLTNGNYTDISVKNGSKGSTGSNATVSLGTATGSGNVVTAIAVSNGVITPTKGITALTSHQDISGKADKATTLAGYGITDAKIESGKITLGSNSITPLTSHQSLANYVDLTSAQTISGVKTFTGSPVIQSALMTLTAGLMNVGLDGATKLFKNGIVITNPTTRNDQGWMRVTGTGESDTLLEIATGDDGDGTEQIVVRSYNTSSVVTREAYIFNASGNMVHSGSITGASIIKSGGTSSQFLKADGSVDGNTYLTSHQSLDGYVNAIAESGTGNVITGVTKSGKTLTFTKGEVSASAVVATISSFPHEDTLTYTKDGATLSYKVGDMVLVKETEDSLGLELFMMVALSGSTATWTRITIHQEEKVTITTNASDGSSTSSASIVVTNASGELLGHGSGSLTLHIDYGTKYTVSFGDYDGNYTTPDSVTYTAGQLERTITGTYTYTPDGVYILDANGGLTTSDNWDTSNNSNAVAVALKSGDYRIAIIKTISYKTMYWNNYDDVSSLTDYTSSTQAKTDMNGESNTDAMIAVDSSTSYAAGYCRQYSINGKQCYLPSLGELYLLYQNKSAIDAALSKCGGTAMNISSDHWTSTQYSSGSAWRLFWDRGDVSSGNKSGNDYVRPVSAF